jgi:hypothetical protein
MVDMRQRSDLVGAHFIETGQEPKAQILMGYVREKFRNRAVILGPRGANVKFKARPGCEMLNHRATFRNSGG